MLCVMGKGYEGMGLGCRKRGLGQAPGKPFSEQGLVRLPMGSFAVSCIFLKAGLEAAKGRGGLGAMCALWGSCLHKNFQECREYFVGYKQKSNSRLGKLVSINQLN